MWQNKIYTFLCFQKQLVILMIQALLILQNKLKTKHHESEFCLNTMHSTVSHHPTMTTIPLLKKCLENFLHVVLINFLMKVVFLRSFPFRWLGCSLYFHDSVLMTKYSCFNIINIVTDYAYSKFSMLLSSSYFHNSVF